MSRRRVSRKLKFPIFSIKSNVKNNVVALKVGVCRRWFARVEQRWLSDGKVGFCVVGRKQHEHDDKRSGLDKRVKPDCDFVRLPNRNGGRKQCNDWQRDQVERVDGAKQNKESSLIRVTFVLDRTNNQSSKGSQNLFFFWPKKKTKKEKKRFFCGFV